MVVEIRSLHFVIAMVAGWLQREQGGVIAYLKEENRVLREQLGKWPINFTDSQRRRLARKGKLVGRRGLLELGCIVTPDKVFALVSAACCCEVRWLKAARTSASSHR